MIEIKQVVTLPPGVSIDVFRDKGEYVVRLEFPGSGADQYEAQHASAMAMGEMIALLKERYEQTLSSVGGRGDTISDGDRTSAFFEARKSELQRRHDYYVRAYLKLGEGAEGSILEYGRAQGLESAMDALGIDFQPIYKTDNPST